MSNMSDARPPLVIVDHLAGSRRGQRQELAATTRARFGRHPDCEVSFDAHRDIDASSRHAELRPVERAWVLVDLGSSNGTFVDGQRVTELAVVAGVAHTIEFGPGGPRVRLFIGEEKRGIWVTSADAAHATPLQWSLKRSAARLVAASASPQCPRKYATEPRERLAMAVA